MFYFQKNKDTITKFKVSFDRQEIEKLKKTIIDNCSLILHREVEAISSFIDEQDRLKIRNLKKQRVIGTLKRENGKEEKLYHFTYDEYIFPPLVNLIDKMLDEEDTNALNEILNPVFQSQVTPFELLYKNTDNSIEFFYAVKLSKKQMSTKTYHEYLKDLISLTKIDTISTNEVIKVDSFFNRMPSI